MNRHLETEFTETTEPIIEESEISKPLWKLKEDRKKFRKKIFGDYYNYSYKRPNQHVIFRHKIRKSIELKKQKIQKSNDQIGFFSKKYNQFSIDRTKEHNL